MDEDINRCRIQGYTTGREKHFKIGIRGLRIDFSAGRIALPSDENGKPWSEVGDLISGLQAYDPLEPTKHTSDCVMAFWLACEMMRRLGQVGGAGKRHLGLT
jgi:hypothetical protein